MDSSDINLYSRNIYISLILLQYDLILPGICVTNDKNILFPLPLNILVPFLTSVHRHSV